MKRAWINVGVGIGCVGLLLTLLLPALMKAREDARRSQCKNNLKQWGVALQNYHDTHQCFPPYVGGTTENGERLSGRVMLTPFLDLPRIWDEIASTPGQGGDPMKFKISSLKSEVGVFVCPSSDIAGRRAAARELCLLRRRSARLSQRRRRRLWSRGLPES